MDLDEARSGDGDRPRVVEAELAPELVHYAVPLPRQPMFGPEQARADVPCAQTLSGEVLSLPIHAFLGDDEVARTAEALRAAVTWH